MVFHKRFFFNISHAGHAAEFVPHIFKEKANKELLELLRPKF